VSDTLAGLLASARESFARYEEEAALRRLLEAWEETHAERIAVLAERLSSLAATRPMPPEGQLGLPRRLEAFGKQADPEHGRSMFEKLRKCLSPPFDPRLSRVLLGLAVLPIAEHPGVSMAICVLLKNTKDPRALGPLRALRASLPSESRYGQLVGSVIESIAAQQVAPLGTEALALCDALEEDILRREEGEARSAPLREALLARVTLHPEDGDARLVLADHLLEQGDPLGELIMLQCQPQPDAARIDGLLEHHQARWGATMLGPGVESLRTRFERGLPVAVHMMVEPGQRLPPPGLLWRTVRELDWNLRGDEVHADWLAHPNLGGVTVLEVPFAMARRLGQHRLPVRRLGLMVAREQDLMGLFTSLASLPHLTEVRVHDSQWGEEVSQCARSPLAPRLERFETSSPNASWSLVVVPRAEVPVEVTVENERQMVMLAEALGAAARFSTRALRIRSQRRLAPDTVRRLEEDAAGYMRVEWDLPPGTG
jgi:uncharacterized protein (TIGR02996 family)